LRKTYITGLLAKQLKETGKKLITTKLIQTGCNGISEDIKEHRKLMGIDMLPEDENHETCPFVFNYPASPHLAARLENEIISVEKIRQLLDKLLNKYNIVLSEGAGGFMVPIHENFLIIDYIKKYKIPMVLVCSSKLGSINHTLLSLLFCISKKLYLHSVIYNQFPDHDKTIAKDTFCFFKKYLNQKFPMTPLIHSENLLNPNLSSEVQKYLQKF